MENRSYAKECGLRCSRLRMAQGMSQQELAEKVFTTAQNISKLEKNGISNIDMIHRISDALGHDIQVDETDAEGVVGEIGKEILWSLIYAGGNKDVYELTQENMYGMKAPRVNQEIFKLEHIGMCVREQYHDFVGEEHDHLFITAKGIITYKGIVGRTVLNDNESLAIERAVSYEELLGDAESYQAFVNQRESEKLIRNIKPLECMEYRINYIRYLKDHFEEGIERDYNYLPDYLEEIVPAKGFYFDLIYRMALHYDRELYGDLIIAETAQETQNELETAENEAFAFSDPVIDEAREMFLAKFPKIEYHDVTDEGLDPEAEPKPAYIKIDAEAFHRYEWKEIQSLEWEKHYDDGEAIYSKSLAEGHSSAYPTDWFTDEQIRSFIEENLRPTGSEAEKQLDEMLLQINELDEKTLDYYRFPAKWEKNGLAQLVREIYKID